jgi:hypothetical protein
MIPSSATDRLAIRFSLAAATASKKNVRFIMKLLWRADFTKGVGLLHDGHGQ